MSGHNAYDREQAEKVAEKNNLHKIKNPPVQESSEAVVGRNYAELASVGFPHMEGIRLRHRDGSGQWFTAKQVENEPELIVKYLNNWMANNCT